MDKAIRRRVRGGITYNLKLLIRGAKGTGKTSLFQRLKGEPIPETHQSTPQLQSATINWSFRQNLEENVKCEVWDVVDRGFVPVAGDGEEGEGSAGSQNAAGGGSSRPVEHGGLQRGGSLSAEASAAAVAAAAVMQNGTHSVAIVDASTVDVYHEAHGVIFLLDITRWDTLEYVKQQLDNVPVHIPTLVLGNFRDQGAQRKIFKEDIQELLYGSTDRPQHQQWRRPMELLYFECSLLNCYGLKSLHQYFGIPFLQLKLATIRQQMRIVEGSSVADDAKSITGEAASQVATDDDVSVVRKENGAATPPTKSAAAPTTLTIDTEVKQKGKEVEEALDTEDLPARSSSAVIQAATPLMFEHKESVTSIPDDVVKDTATRSEDKTVPLVVRNSKASATANATSGRSRKASEEEVIHLEDFQVPKTRTSDLDHFYSEDESDEDVDEYDEDVVVAPADGAMKTNISGVYHKQRFIDSDSSDSDESGTAGEQRKRKGKTSQKSSPRRTATKQASATDQQVPRPPASSPHPPTSSSRPNQRSRPGSPARQQPSSPVKDVQDDVSPKQKQSSSTSMPTVVVSPTPPMAPPTSPLASPIRHSSPRNKNSISTAAPQPETSSSLSQDESEIKQESSSSEEPELTGAEDANGPMGLDKQEDAKEITKQASPKNSDSAFSPSKDADGDVSPPPSETEEMIDDGSSAEDIESSIQPDMAHEVVLNDADSDSYDDPEEVVRVPSNDRVNESAEKEDVFPATGRENGGLGATSDELKTFLADDSSDGDEEGDDAPIQNEMPVAEEAVSQIPQHPSPVHHRPEILMSDEESDDGNRDAAAGLSLTSLQASLPIPESSSSSAAVLSASVGTHSPGYGNGSGSTKIETTALQLSDLQESPVKSSSISALTPDFTAVVPSNDLEAFLNESDSDSENAPPSYAAPSGGAKQSRQNDRRAMVESSDDSDDEEEEQDRFASYNISKKSRSERRRQQKEDLRQLNAALDTAGMVNDPFAAPFNGVAAAESSFGSSGVMEAIRKAQEEAMRMIPSAPATADDDDAASSSSKRRHRHKHKHKHKKREGDDGKEKPAKKSSRKSGSSARSKKRRPHVEDDLA
uniref:GTP-binding protein Parf n=1 Tax=Phytophthora ramorum TaxID=164328 RepID=H3GGN8_PHYRM